MNEKVIPNKAFDMQYSTMWKKEYEYLKQNNIEPVFVKKTIDYNIKVYKYKKTAKLFDTLKVFYSKIEEERMNSDG